MNSFTPDDLDLDPGKAREDALAEAQAWEEQERLLAVARAETVEARAQRQVHAEEMTLTDEIAQAMRKSTLEDLELAKQPHPHLFRDGVRACFPRREVSVVAGAGREGKTSALVAIAVAGALGQPLNGQLVERMVSTGKPTFTTVIFSAEDDRRQFDGKLGEQVATMRVEDKKTVLERVRVVDLAPIKARVGPLVMALHGQAQPNIALMDAIIGACSQPVDGSPIDGGWDAPLGLLILETASTLSNAGEDNIALAVLAETAKQIAGALDVAVILSHHTSQASAANLPTLEISVGDIRGATALVYNSRQNWMLVNLGSDETGFKDRDARTVLRQMIAPDSQERISMLVCLDSSKSKDPAPIFYEWNGTRQAELVLPPALAGLHWRKLHRKIGKAKAETQEEAKSDAEAVEIKRVCAAVHFLHEAGQQPTVSSVATRLGRGKSWTAPRLATAVSNGRLRAIEEAVPRTRGLTLVYRPLEDEA